MNDLILVISFLKKINRIQIEGRWGSKSIGLTDDPGTFRVSWEYAEHTKTGLNNYIGSDNIT